MMKLDSFFDIFATVKKKELVAQKITYFNPKELRGMKTPPKFTFPFFYEPDELTQLAVTDLQKYLEEEFESHHNFGLDDSQEGLVIGKMFGVMVVEDDHKNLGYISAFSGKLADRNIHPKFVPPVFDMLTENGFFKKEEAVLNEINARVTKLENDESFKNLKEIFVQLSVQSETEIASFKKGAKTKKAERKRLREEQKPILSERDYSELEGDLIKQSYRDQYELKHLISDWKEKLTKLCLEIDKFENEIEELKRERKEKSSTLQNKLFKQYSFLNKDGISKDLSEIFSETIFEKPPAAAGECAAPKLLQFAFTHHLKPISFAEFWWGASPKSEIRQHKQFYPACSGKCRPILKHMLAGMEIDDNPLLKNLAEDKQLRIVYQDDEIIVVNKPAELLSVPGIEVQDSVYTRLQNELKTIEPLIVHRLDMSTSGLLVVAKTKDAHKFIQRQFLKRTVKKRYTALLSKKINQAEGEIHLPLRPNLFDRPRQLVDFEKGKKSVTKWKKIESDDLSTRVHFWPVTGRTHQLRVHSAHPDGLNASILGDDLYGKARDRLYLHASFLEFIHPKTREILKFEVKEDF